MLRAGNKIETFLHNNKTQDILGVLLILNAAVLGMETYPNLMSSYGAYLKTLDTVILYVFAVELILRLVAGGFRFFKCGWNIFDFTVISISILASATSFSALRTLRILRLLRFLSISDGMKFLISSLGRALPGILNIAVILLVMFYISAVVACLAFGADNAIFSSLTRSMYTLFQLMLGDNFGELTNTVMETHPHAYLFFIPYMVVMSFTILNLFFGLIVGSMQGAAEEENTKALAKHAGVEHDSEMTQNKLILSELKELRKQISELKKGM
ncbi:MAG: ion transporter [Alphaproteobacteria bacterium]|nr:ion transporter [Alphaproteobacteria bacterium]